MKTTCSLVLILAALLFAIPAHADSSDQVLNVQVGPSQFGQLDETASLSFDWQPSTNTLFNIDLAVDGPFSGYSATPFGNIGFIPPNGSTFDPLGGINDIDFFNGQFVIQFDFGANGGLGVVQPMPGMYLNGSGIDLFAVPTPGDPSLVTTFFASSNATVTISNDPVPTPEPNAAFFLFFGATAVLLLQNRINGLRRRSDE
jgi:hypothetical protein